ncbi:MAG: hypothetical protein JSU86_19945 [Phycisphaerales bacterium]|nr:MAG: hypothetical protein JSU86_19945 [Phycisphaerales bacterium]
MAMRGHFIDRVRQYRSLAKLILDLNPGAPGVSQAYGRRERSSSPAAVERSGMAVRCSALLDVPIPLRIQYIWK